MAKLDAAGDRLFYSTRIGGSGDDTGAGVALDDSGITYVMGTTTSTDFPLVNPTQSRFSQGPAVFIMKLSGDPADTATPTSTSVPVPTPTPTPIPVKTATLMLCGAVGGVTQSTATASGSLTIGGITLTLARDATLAGAPPATGVTACVLATLDASVGIVIGGSIVPSSRQAAALSVCGIVGAYTSGGSVTSGSVTIAGIVLSFAPGTMPAGGTIVPGGRICLNAGLDAGGRVSAIQIDVPLSAILGPTPIRGSLSVRLKAD